MENSPLFLCDNQSAAALNSSCAIDLWSRGKNATLNMRERHQIAPLSPEGCLSRCGRSKHSISISVSVFTFSDG